MVPSVAISELPPATFPDGSGTSLMKMKIGSESTPNKIGAITKTCATEIPPKRMITPIRIVPR